jgi:hypothetical protein
VPPKNQTVRTGNYRRRFKLCLIVRPDDDRLSFETSSEVKVKSSFEDMGLREDLLRGIYAYGIFTSKTQRILKNFVGFEKPSAIQQRAILPVVSGRDVIAQAQSGSHHHFNNFSLLISSFFRYWKNSNILHRNSSIN